MTDALLSLLPTADDADRPWLVSYTPTERIELSGHVLSMWQSKTAGLLADLAPAHPSVHLALEPGWRLVTWCCGTWLAGGAVAAAGPSGARGGDGERVPADAGRDTSGATWDASGAGTGADVSVAQAESGLDPDSEVQVLVPTASLAVRWPGELPVLVVDGAADLMTYPDRTTPVPCAPGAPALRALGPNGRADATTTVPSPLTREALARRAGDGPGAEAAALARREGARAVLVPAADAPTVIVGVLAAWRAGLTAVLVSGDADGALLATAARQEGAPRTATPRPSPRRSARDAAPLTATPRP